MVTVSPARADDSRLAKAWHGAATQACGGLRPQLSAETPHPYPAGGIQCVDKGGRVVKMVDLPDGAPCREMVFTSPPFPVLDGKARNGYCTDMW